MDENAIQATDPVSSAAGQQLKFIQLDLTRIHVDRDERLQAVLPAWRPAPSQWQGS